MTGVDLPGLDLGTALVALLDAIAASPFPTPCARSRLWTSKNPTDRDQAVRYCRDHCPHLLLCQAAAAEQPREELDGVWGGDNYERRKKTMTQPEPPEAIAFEPMSPLEHRLQVAGSFTAVRMLLPHLEVSGLHELRAWLRHDDTRRTCAGAALAHERAALLERTCRRLVDLGVGPMEYFEGVGDVVPQVPDDLSGMP